MRVDRFTLGVWPTPLRRLDRIEARLGCGPLYAKRDDLAGFGVAGNKTRPLEYLVAAALTDGADVLVTGGRADSNFCPATAAAAAAAGLGCELVMADAEHPSPNMRLSVALGARLNHVQATGDAIDKAIYARADELSAQGRQPYAIPRGGSTPIGALGFANAARELDAQLGAVDDLPGAVVCAVGSGGSFAGLLVGATELDWSWPVYGASVSRPLPEMTEKVRQLAGEAAWLRGSDAPSSAWVDESWLIDAIGPGHGELTGEERALARLAAREEGLLLDDTYTAKSFALAVRTAREDDAPVIWWHTGGIAVALSRLEKLAEPEATGA